MISGNWTVVFPMIHGVALSLELTASIPEIIIGAGSTAM
jgi:hypothetical protein